MGDVYGPVGGSSPGEARAADGNSVGRLRSGTRSTRWGLIAVTCVFLALTAAPLLGLFAYAPCSMVFCPATVVILRKTLILTVSSSLAATLAAVTVGLPTALCLARLPDHSGRRPCRGLRIVRLGPFVKPSLTVPGEPGN